MFKEYYPISENARERFIIMHDDKTGRFAILKNVKPEIIRRLKIIEYKFINLPRIYEFGHDFIIEEQLEGERLSDILEYEKISIYDTKKMISDICIATKELHRVGIAHMDISPENIIKVDGNFYLIDYSATIELGKKITDLSYGTTEFCSPEHYGFDIVSEASDVYSMGKLLSYLLHLSCAETQKQIFKDLIDNATAVSTKDRIKSIDEFLVKFKNVCRQHTKINTRNDILSINKEAECAITLSTQDIFNSMNTLSDLADFIRENKNNFIDTSVEKYFSRLITNKNLRKADVVKNSGIERTYAYQILNGTKNPSRDKMIALCVGAHLNIEEVQMALKYTGFMPLYPRVKRDAIIIYGIKTKKGICEIEEHLYRFGEHNLNDA